MHFVNHRDKHLSNTSSYASYFKLYEMLSFAYWAGRRILTLINQLKNLSILTKIFEVIPGISMAMTYFDFLHDLISNTLTSERSMHTRIFKVAILLISAPIAIASFILTTKLLNVAAASLNIANNLWDIATVGCSKLFGKLKNNPDKELNRAANYKIAENSHMLLINAGFLIGTILLLNPATFAAGCIALVCVTGYAIVDRFNINPLRMLANKIFNHPFKSDITSDETEITANGQSTPKIKKFLRPNLSKKKPAFSNKGNTQEDKTKKYLQSVIEQRLGTKVGEKIRSKGMLCHPR